MRFLGSPQLRLGRLAFAALLAALYGTPLILFLCAEPIRIWDEARNAMSAWEMFTSGDYLSVTFEGEPDFWSPKPLLYHWTVTLSYALVGPSVLALRLPSVLCALATVGILLGFSRTILGRWEYGIVAALVLVCSPGYIQYFHGARSGDFDAMLTLFTALYFCAFVAYLVAPDRRMEVRALVLFFAGLTLATLTKGIAGLLFTPAVPILLAVCGRWKAAMRDPVLYGGALASFALIMLHYVGREWVDPGYLRAVWESEIGGRAGSSLSNHSGPWYFYLESLYVKRYTVWIFLLPAGLAAWWIAKERTVKTTILAATVFSTIYLLVVSTAQTKLAWYDTPLFPLFALLVAAALVEGTQLLLAGNPLASETGARVRAKAFLYALVFASPYFGTLKGLTPWEEPYYDTGDYMQAVLDEPPAGERLRLIREGYHPERWIYFHYARHRGIDAEVTDYDSLGAGDLVVAVNRQQVDRLGALFSGNEVQAHKSLHLVRLGTRR